MMSTMLPGLFIILTGPSGVGKTTVAQALLRRLPDLRASVSCTTRPPRPGEVHGKDYFFVSEGEFLKMREKQEFFESVYLHGAWRGTPKAPALKNRSRGLDTLFVIDGEGRRAIQQAFDVVDIFLLPPSQEQLLQRLKNRNQDSPDEIRRRFDSALQEMAYAEDYRYKVVNDLLPQCIDEIEKIMTNEKKAQRAGLWG